MERQPKLHYKKNSYEHGKSFVDKMNMPEKTNPEGLPDVNYDLLLGNRGLWKNKILEIFGQETITQFEELLPKLTLRGYRRPFTLFLLEHKRPRRRCRKKLNETENQKLYGELNTKVADVWRKLKDDKKAVYNNKSKNEKILYNLEFFIVNQILFLGYDGITHNCVNSDQKIYEVKRRLEIYNDYMQGIPFPQDIDKLLSDEWGELSIDDRKAYVEKFKRIQSLIKDAENLKIKFVYRIFEKEKSIENNEENNVINIWGELDNLEKEHYYQIKHKQICEDEILSNVKCLIKNEYMEAPSQPSGMFEEDIKNNFLSCNKIGFESSYELWINSPQEIKTLYEEKYKRKLIAYNFMKIIKDTITNKNEKDQIPKVNLNKLRLEIMNEKLDDGQKIEEKDFKIRYKSLNKEEKKEIDKEVKKRRKALKHSIKKNIILDIKRKRFSSVEIYAKEHPIEMQLELNNKDGRSYMEIAKGLFNNLKDEEKMLYQKKRLELNLDLLNRHAEKNNKGFINKNEFDWYYKKHVTHKPQDAQFAYDINDKQNKQDKILWNINSINLIVDNKINVINNINKVDNGGNGNKNSIYKINEEFNVNNIISEIGQCMVNKIKTNKENILIDNNNKTYDINIEISSLNNKPVVQTITGIESINKNKEEIDNNNNSKLNEEERELMDLEEITSQEIEEKKIKTNIKTKKLEKAENKKKNALKSRYRGENLIPESKRNILKADNTHNKNIRRRK